MINIHLSLTGTGENKRTHALRSSSSGEGIVAGGAWAWQRDCASQHARTCPERAPALSTQDVPWARACSVRGLSAALTLRLFASTLLGWGTRKSERCPDDCLSLSGSYCLCKQREGEGFAEPGWAFSLLGQQEGGGTGVRPGRIAATGRRGRGHCQGFEEIRRTN